VSVAPGFTWYNYPNADPNNGFYKSTFEPNIALKLHRRRGETHAQALLRLILKGPTYEFTAAYTIPLKDLGSELDWIATAGTFKIDDAAKGASPAVKNWAITTCSASPCRLRSPRIRSSPLVSPTRR